uniref:Uncharacterized protein n=1 Tax=Anopheles maculatus TaxID=74869 RepID=A0A182S6W6_9DIPT
GIATGLPSAVVPGIVAGGIGGSPTPPTKKGFPRAKTAEPSSPLLRRALSPDRLHPRSAAESKCVLSPLCCNTSLKTTPRTVAGIWRSNQNSTITTAAGGGPGGLQLTASCGSNSSTVEPSIVSATQNSVNNNNNGTGAPGGGESLAASGKTAGGPPASRNTSATLAGEKSAPQTNAPVSSVAAKDDHMKSSADKLVPLMEKMAIKDGDAPSTTSINNNGGNVSKKAKD